MQNTAWKFVMTAFCAFGLVTGAEAADAIDRTVLPVPEAAFKGEIGMTVKDSKPDFPTPIKAPEGAPNVLIVLLDDVGFGHAGAFGGAVSTPTMDRLSAEGLRYTTFHTTALCSPTRAALLTGRNHHSVGTGVVIEMGTGYPGLYRHRAQLCRRPAGNPPPERLFHRRLRQVAQHAGHGDQHRGALRALAHRQDLGLRIFLRLHERRDPPVLSAALPQHDAGGAAEIARGGLSRHRRHG